MNALMDVETLNPSYCLDFYSLKYLSPSEHGVSWWSHIYYDSYDKFKEAWNNCDGELNIFCHFMVNKNDEENTFTLYLYVILPRKSASRAIRIDNIVENELPDIVSFLHACRENVLGVFKNLSDNIETWRIKEGCISSV